MKIFCKDSRHSLRLNSGTQIALEATKNFSQATTVPLRISQAFVSGIAASKSKCITETLVHTLHSAIAIIQASLIVVTLFDKECSTYNTTVCKAAFVFDLLYQGLLLCAWANSEINKTDETLTNSMNINI